MADSTGFHGTPTPGDGNGRRMRECWVVRLCGGRADRPLTAKPAPFRLQPVMNPPCKDGRMGSTPSANYQPGEHRDHHPRLVALPVGCGFSTGGIHQCFPIGLLSAPYSSVGGLRITRRVLRGVASWRTSVPPTGHVPNAVRRFPRPDDDIESILSKPEEVQVCREHCRSRDKRWEATCPVDRRCS